MVGTLLATLFSLVDRVFNIQDLDLMRTIGELQNKVCFREDGVELSWPAAECMWVASAGTTLRRNRFAVIDQVVVAGALQQLPCGALSCPRRPSSR